MRPRAYIWNSPKRSHSLYFSTFRTLEHKRPVLQFYAPHTAFLPSCHRDQSYNSVLNYLFPPSHNFNILISSGAPHVLNTPWVECFLKCYSLITDYIFIFNEQLGNSFIIIVTLYFLFSTFITPCRFKLYILVEHGISMRWPHHLQNVLGFCAKYLKCFSFSSTLHAHETHEPFLHLVAVKYRFIFSFTFASIQISQRLVLQSIICNFVLSCLLTNDFAT